MEDEISPSELGCAQARDSSGGRIFARRWAAGLLTRRRRTGLRDRLRREGGGIPFDSVESRPTAAATRSGARRWNPLFLRRARQ